MIIVTNDILTIIEYRYFYNMQHGQKISIFSLNIYGSEIAVRDSEIAVRDSEIAVRDSEIAVGGIEIAVRGSEITVTG